MNQKELKELIEFIIEKDIAEFELERGDVKLRIKRGGAEPQVAVDPRFFVAPQPQPAAQAASAAAATSAPASPASASPPAATTAEVAEEAGLHIVRSPIVGTFYEAASPGAPPFVKPGDTVAVGQVLCIIEAMKLMNEIESDFAGELVNRYVSNAQPVEYGQPLFAIRTQ
jgi:acetyl-CoA carboxylase biotin carboxyl carrier protein